MGIKEVMDSIVAQSKAYEEEQAVKAAREQAARATVLANERIKTEAIEKLRLQEVRRIVELAQLNRQFQDHILTTIFLPSITELRDLLDRALPISAAPFEIERTTGTGLYKYQVYHEDRHPEGIDEDYNSETVEYRVPYSYDGYSLLGVKEVAREDERRILGFRYKPADVVKTFEILFAGKVAPLKGSDVEFDPAFGIKHIQSTGHLSFNDVFNPADGSYYDKYNILSGFTRLPVPEVTPDSFEQRMREVTDPTSPLHSSLAGIINYKVAHAGVYLTGRLK